MKNYAKIIKKKYPMYSDINDKDLTEKILRKYPELKRRVKMN